MKENKRRFVLLFEEKGQWYSARCKKQNREEFGEKMEKEIKIILQSKKTLRRENNKYEATNWWDVLRLEKQNIERWKECFEELLNVKSEIQPGDDEEDDIQEHKEELRYEAIIT